MSPAAIAAFAARSSSAREAAWGVSCIYDGQTFRATASSERDARTLRDGGFTQEYDRLLRITRTALTDRPRPETTIDLPDKSYRIKEVRTIPATNEWLLGLVQIC